MPELEFAQPKNYSVKLHLENIENINEYEIREVRNTREKVAHIFIEKKKTPSTSKDSTPKDLHEERNY